MNLITENLNNTNYSFSNHTKTKLKNDENKFQKKKIDNRCYISDKSRFMLYKNIKFHYNI